MGQFTDTAAWRARQAWWKSNLRNLLQLGSAAEWITAHTMWEEAQKMEYFSVLWRGCLIIAYRNDLVNNKFPHTLCKVMKGGLRRTEKWMLADAITHLMERSLCAWIYIVSKCPQVSLSFQENMIANTAHPNECRPGSSQHIDIMGFHNVTYATLTPQTVSAWKLSDMTFGCNGSIYQKTQATVWNSLTSREFTKWLTTFYRKNIFIQLSSSWNSLNISRFTCVRTIT